MDLILDEEQIEFQQTFRKFCEQEIAPLADCIEAEGIQNEVYRKLGSAGYLGLLHPEQYGGQGASFLTAVLAQSALAYHCGSTFFSSGASAGLAGLPISHFGSEEQKARFLPGLISGQSVGCLAVTESGSGSDVASIATTLKRQPAGLLLNGNKAYITNAPNADFALVLARYCRDGQIPSGASGLTLCIVDLHSAGVSRGQPLKKMGLRGSPTGELFFDNVEIPEANILGRPGAGFRQTMKAFDWERLSMGAYCLGVMEACLDESRSFAKKRKSFGRAISRHQSVAFMLADIKTRLEASRLMLFETAWLFDRAGGSGKLEHNGEILELSARASELKLMTSQYARECTNLAVQIHGGAGYMEEYRVSRLYRDIKISEIGGGTSEIQKQIIARAETRRSAAV
ncbi:MAG TPA: acyl-CoA dehydrogenase [Leptospiraceae bacterium]|nr:acyl-CoA dehydrogenase [Spirochaetaceae bacterium]HBS05569.1 acyl-CoA dehydrogenase [Leptospiraceae bacterium]